jgi:hypothetical protein
MKWDGVDLQFDGMAKEVKDVRFSGEGSTIVVDATRDFVMPPAQQQSHDIFIYRPYIKDFSDFAVVDRDGNLVGDILINGGFVADKRYSWTADCPTI